MKRTFDQACASAATGFYLLRQRAEFPDLFDRAVQHMRDQRYRCDTDTGTTRNKDGVVAQFTDYDGGHQYEDAPHFVFYDFFQGPLLNKYSRLLRGLD